MKEFLEDKLRRTEADAELGLSSQWEKISGLGMVVNFINWLAGQFWIKRGGKPSSEVEKDGDTYNAGLATKIIFLSTGGRRFRKIVERKLTK